MLATATPDQTFPATATKVQAELGMTGGAAFDLQAVCAGFVYGVSVADSMIKNGVASTALVIGAETFSRILDWNDRGTCVLFGDGAGAIVLRGEAGQGHHEPIAACLPTRCIPTAASTTSSMSMAGRPRPRRPAFCAWKARKSSSMPWSTWRRWWERF